MSLTSYHFTSNQQVDQPLTTIVQSPFRCRFAYAKAGETALYKENNQDFLAFRIDENALSFIMCDGVSLSYRGDFAAHFLGTHLLNWISATGHAERNEASFHEYLHSLRECAAEQMSRLTVPSDLPLLLRDVLEDKKRIGSETMFICGRVDVFNGIHPYHRIWLTWHGDVRLRLWQHGQESGEFLGGSNSTRQRWSAARGLIGGRACTWQQQVEGRIPSRLLVYTDGFSDLDDRQDPPKDEQLRRKLEHTNGEWLGDDASFLDIIW